MLRRQHILADALKTAKVITKVIIQQQLTLSRCVANKSVTSWRGSNGKSGVMEICLKKFRLHRVKDAGVMSV